MAPDELEIPRWEADYEMSIVAQVEPRDLARFAVAAADTGTETQQVTDLRAAAKLLATAADWLFLLPNLVGSTAQAQGVVQNATTLSFDVTESPNRLIRPRPVVVLKVSLKRLKVPAVRGLPRVSKPGWAFRLAQKVTSK